MFKILLVDDEPIIKIGVRKLLEGTDYIIAGTASNGSEALLFLETNSVDIILTDLRQYRTTATIRITGRPFCKNQLGRPCFCSQERTDSSCQAGSVSQNQIR